MALTTASHERTANSPFQKASAFADESILFPALNTTLPALESLDKAKHSITPFIADLDDEFEAPSHVQAQPYESPATQLRDSGRPASSLELEQELPCIWSEQPAEAQRSCAQLTWEVFQTRSKSTDSMSGPISLSNAGIDAYNAALGERTSSHQFLPQATVLHSLRSLVLGRASILYPWSDHEQCFVATLPDVGISGLSVESTQSLIAHMIGYGTTFRRLRNAAEQQDVRIAWSGCAAADAFRRCLACILDVVDEALSSRLDCIGTILGLHSLTLAPMTLFSHLVQLLTKLSKVINDEEAITICTDHQAALFGLQDRHACLFAAILIEVCKPWVQSFTNCLEMAKSASVATVPIMAPRTGLSAMQALMNLRQSTIGFQGMGILEHIDVTSIEDISTSIKLLIDHSTKNDGRTRCESMVVGDALHSKSQLDNNAVPCHSFLDAVSTLDAQMEVMPARGMSSLEHALSSLTREALRLTAEGQITLLQDLARPLSDPYSTMRARLLNEIAGLNFRVMRCLFDEHFLREHLQVQWEFHLFGNGDFVAYLVAALFSTDAQDAERRRGVVPTSNTLGLRLDTHHDRSWPPASSELRLTLTSIVEDSCQTVKFSTNKFRKSRDEVPGGLSFAIRELSDAEIDRVMDPKSIYALDFLRLQYTAPTPLKAVLTAETMQQYDDIFRFLLRLIRVNHVAATMRAAILKHAAHQRSSMLARSSFEAYHVSSVLMSHFMEIGIRDVWDTFMQQIDDVIVATQDTKPENASPSIQLGSLRQCHCECLDRIRERLFLLHKQRGVQLAIERVFTAILELAYSTPEMERHVTSLFRTAMLQLMNSLNDLSRKSSVHGYATASTLSSSYTIELLASRLDWQHD